MPRPLLHYATNPTGLTLAGEPVGFVRPSDLQTVSQIRKVSSMIPRARAIVKRKINNPIVGGVL